EVVTRALFNPRLEGKPFMVAGTFGFVLSFLTTIITAVSIVNERLTGTFDQLQVTPATSAEILLGKLLPLGAVFAFDVVVMMLVAGFVLGVWPQGNALLFVAVSSGYVFFSLALGLYFSATSSTAAEAAQKTVLFSIPLVQLSGFAFPTRNMPFVFRWLAEVFPATHYIRVSRAIYLRAAGPEALAWELAVLALSGVGFMAPALRTLAVLVGPDDFERDAGRGRPRVQLLLDGSDPLSAARIGAYVAEVAGAFATRVVPASARHAAPRLPGPIDVRQRFWFNPTLSDRVFFLAAFAGMLLTNLCLSVTSGGLVGEREMGTYEQMLALPTTPLEIVLGKLVPYVVVCYGLLLFAVLSSGLVFGIWPQGSWLALFAITLPFVLASLAIGVLVSVLAQTTAQSVFITVFFIMPSFVLSGVMYPY